MSPVFMTELCDLNAFCYNGGSCDFDQILLDAHYSATPSCT